MTAQTEMQAAFVPYQVGDTAIMGTWEDRPLLWHVADANGKMRLLIAQDIVAQKPYHERYIDTSWRDCSLSRWLNGAFLRQAFTPEERLRILNTRVQNAANPRYVTNGGLPAVNKLFLLDIDEARRYFPTDEDRRLDRWWWLRTPGSSLLSAVSVYTDGSIYDTGINIDYKEGGVRPAMWILLKQ